MLRRFEKDFLPQGGVSNLVFSVSEAENTPMNGRLKNHHRDTFT